MQGHWVEPNSSPLCHCAWQSVWGVAMSPLWSCLCTGHWSRSHVICSDANQAMVPKFNKLGHPDLTGSSKGVFSFLFYVAVKNEEKVEISINKNSAICLRAATYFPAKVNKQSAAFLDKYEIIKSIHVGVWVLLKQICTQMKSCIFLPSLIPAFSTIPWSAQPSRLQSFLTFSALYMRE